MTITEQGFWALGVLGCLIWAIAYIVHDVMLSNRLDTLNVFKDPQVEWFHNATRMIFFVPMMALLVLCIGKTIYLETFAS